MLLLRGLQMLLLHGCTMVQVSIDVLLRCMHEQPCQGLGFKQLSASWAFGAEDACCFRLGLTERVQMSREQRQHSSHTLRTFMPCCWLFHRVIVETSASLAI
jgi:hypothetical protein